MTKSALMTASARLELRPYRLDDFDNMHGLMSREDATLYPPRDPFTEEESWTRLLRHVGHWSAFGFGFFAVEERASGRFVGEAGFSYFRRGLGPRYGDAPEATWTMVPDRQGRGYASEAAAAAHLWAEEKLRLPRTLCMIHVDNAPSLAVAARLGYREMARETYTGHPVIFFERPGPR